MGRQGTNDPRPNRSRRTAGGAGRTGGPRAPSGQGQWTVERTLPERRRRGPQETEYRVAVAAALADGRPRSRTLPTDREARLLGRRLRYAASTLGARLRVRFTPDDEAGGVKIIFSAEPRE